MRILNLYIVLMVGIAIAVTHFGRNVAVNLGLTPVHFGMLVSVGVLGLIVGILYMLPRPLAIKIAKILWWPVPCP